MAKKTIEDVLVDVHSHCEEAAELAGSELGALDAGDCDGNPYEVPLKALRAIRKELCKAVTALDKKIDA